MYNNLILNTPPILSRLSAHRPAPEDPFFFFCFCVLFWREVGHCKRREATEVSPTLCPHSVGPKYYLSVAWFSLRLLCVFWTS
jgi:hypothetical protein